MTESEICVSYRQAKNKKKQIRILAELNATTQTEIKIILAKCGMSARKESSKRRISASGVYDENLCERYIRLADAGLDAKQIALELGVTADTAKNFLKRHKIITAPTKPKERAKKNDDDRIRDMRELSTGKEQK